MTVAPALAAFAAAFAAAGNDIDALEKAIEEAAYLDATPGEDRQKLRGAPAPPARTTMHPSAPSRLQL